LKNVEDALQGRSFYLIEKLAGFVHDAVRSFIISTAGIDGKDVALRVEVTKPRPLVVGLSEAVFVCSDW
jgi:dihydroneopterin aldolase